MSVRLLAGMLLFALTLPGFSAPAKRALLVGVGSYRSEQVDPLLGPVNDVNSLRSVLTNRWGFNRSNIVTLTDRRATRKAILRELERLREVSRSGDFVLFYFSGHGTSVRDEKVGLPLPDCTGALAPWDFATRGSAEVRLASVLLGRRDLRPLFEAMDAKGVHIFVVTDSCFSGYASRSVGGRCPTALRRRQGVKKYVPLKVPSRLPQSRTKGSGARSADTCNNPYQNLVALAAASIKEEAIDLGIAGGEFDRKPHGAFTDSLLMVLDAGQSSDADGGGTVTYRELFSAVDMHMQRRSYPHQPKLLPSRREDEKGVTTRSIFAARGVPPVETPAAPPSQALRLMLVRDARQSSGKVRQIVNHSADARAFEGIAGVTLVSSAPDRVLHRHAGGWTLWSAHCERAATATTRREALRLARQHAWIHRLLRRPAQQELGIALAVHGRSGDIGQQEREFFSQDESVRVVATLGGAAYLLVINIASDGSLKVLYPISDSEARQRKKTISFDTRVTPPYGIEYTVALALDKPQDWYSKLPRRTGPNVRVEPGAKLHDLLVAKMLDEQVSKGWALAPLVTKKR